MTRNIEFELLRMQSVKDMRVELVERKGLGHPDYIADAASEVASRALCKYYLKEFNTLLHHNLDKTLLVGGQASPRFGGGVVVEPIYIIVAGRATTDVRIGGATYQVPFGKLVVEAVKEWIKSNFRYLDPESHVIVDYKIRKGSTDLVAVFEKGKEQVPLANDTSIGVGFAPLSPLERLVYETERLLNSRDFKKKYPAVGEDIKVMGLRKDKHIVLTIATAIIDREVRNERDYKSIKNNVIEEVKALAHKIVPDYGVEVNVNTADIEEKGIYYITVTGTSAEHGDDGATGRGNRANGLITPMRPISLEATAGKNPVNHVGKIYNVLAKIIAEKVYKNYEHLFSDIYIEILSQIGKPINEPLIASVKAIPRDFNVTEIPGHVKSDIISIVDEELSNVRKVTELILNDQVILF
ncbi:MAG: methionine adenosyltransferase [Desulfurococcaceae archaeon]|nr:methionine adenosyltransferase [Desulfurococcaceae archaeon]